MLFTSGAVSGYKSKYCELEGRREVDPRRHWSASGESCPPSVGVVTGDPLRDVKEAFTCNEVMGFFFFFLGGFLLHAASEREL